MEGEGGWSRCYKCDGVVAAICFVYLGVVRMPDPASCSVWLCVRFL